MYTQRVSLVSQSVFWGKADSLCSETLREHSLGISRQEESWCCQLASTFIPRCWKRDYASFKRVFFIYSPDTGWKSRSLPLLILLPYKVPHSYGGVEDLLMQKVRKYPNFYNFYIYSSYQRIGIARLDKQTQWWVPTTRQNCLAAGPKQVFTFLPPPKSRVPLGTMLFPTPPRNMVIVFSGAILRKLETVLILACIHYLKSKKQNPLVSR